MASDQAAQDHAAARSAGQPTPGEEQLVRRALPVLQELARRLWHRLGGVVELEELVGLGHGALVDIVRSYDPQRATFDAYAAVRLRWAMLDGVRRATHGRAAMARARALAASDQLTPAVQAKALRHGDAEPGASHRAALRRLLAAHAGALVAGLVAATAGQTPATDSARDPEQVTIRAATARRLRHAVAELPERQRTILERHYFDDEQFTHIAADLGISKSRASRLHLKALRTLARRLRRP